ncbi:MAG: HD domain-containing protein [Cyclobacteriaceae bacterium]|nr:HD domain-containing protein [Cyclobacteriaceae bacterium]
MNKKKILNDPVYGFIHIQNDLVYDIIQHPYFQRLRRIKQLGLSDFVYPGALHTRFHHALGAMHLMGKALDTLRAKGHMIFETEYEAALIAILLHDIGHGPFSHTLEFSLFDKVKHEQITLWILRRLNQQFNGRLELAIQIYEGKYPRKFLTQLVSSQLDTDRMDYLKRDSYFTGVQEGTIGAERILKMLNVVDDQLVVEEKGIYSIESFLSARRIMYWQVYLHKTSISAEKMLTQLIRRARFLRKKGVDVMATPAFSYFLERNISASDFDEDPDLLEIFMTLDDTDIWGSIKFWVHHDDTILQMLANMLVRRHLFGIRTFSKKVPQKVISQLKQRVKDQYGFSSAEVSYFVHAGEVSNSAYLPKGERINILSKNGKIMDIARAVDLPNIKAISKIVKKYYLCWPKDVSLGVDINAL